MAPHTPTDRNGNPNVFNLKRLVRLGLVSQQGSSSATYYQAVF